MSTSSNGTPTAAPARGPLRLQMAESPVAGRVDGAWWPRSRDLQQEAADLVDHLPASVGRVSRLLFSRPDWDDSAEGGRGIRMIRAARGPVKVGSFPSDDTHLMILTMSSGDRLKLAVIPSDTPQARADELMRAVARGTAESLADWARWDNESPGE